MRPIIFFLAVLLLGCSSDDASFEFALMGDAPYLEEHVNEVRKLIADVNEEKGVQWVIHLGDTKGGSDPCDDAVLRGRFELFDTFEKPFLSRQVTMTGTIASGKRQVSGIATNG